MAKSKGKIVRSKPPDLAKLTPEVLLRKAAAAHKRATVHAERAVKHMTDCILAHLEAGRFLVEWREREKIPHGQWLTRLNTEYCDPNSVSERTALRSVLFASVDEGEFLANLPSMANIDKAERTAQQLKRGKVIEHKPSGKEPPTEASEQPPTSGTPPLPPDDDDLEVDADGNVVRVRPPTPGNADLLAFAQPPPTEAPDEPTPEQRQAVRDFIKAALADVKIEASVDKALAFLEALGIGERELVERDVAGLNVE